MDKTIEKKFFEAFKWGGVVNNCIEWVRYTYNLPPMKPITDRDKQLQNEAGGAANKTWKRYYEEVLPKEIQEATEAFDDSVIMYDDSPLMDEIEANLNEYQIDAQREKYLFSLLKPFGSLPNGCEIARIYVPQAEINQIEAEIKEIEKDKARLDAISEIEQIQACDDMINRRKDQIKWVLYVNNKFCNITGGNEDGAKWMQVGTVESCLHAFVNVAFMFANRLDALLLAYGIDLMRLQRESGLYLKDHRLITDVDCYVGSRELAQRYIDLLPKEYQPEQAPLKTTDGKRLNTECHQMDIKQILPEPPEPINTDEAKKRFSKAVQAGLMQPLSDRKGYQWNESNALLAYFCGKIYCCDRLIQDAVTKDWMIKRGDLFFPEKALMSFFFNKEGKEIRNLGQSRLQMQRPPKGYKKIDILFDEAT